jgi:hypothetical protein
VADVTAPAVPDTGAGASRAAALTGEREAQSAAAGAGDRAVARTAQAAESEPPAPGGENGQAPSTGTRAGADAPAAASVTAGEAPGLGAAEQDSSVQAAEIRGGSATLSQSASIEGEATLQGRRVAQDTGTASGATASGATTTGATASGGSSARPGATGETASAPVAGRPQPTSDGGATPAATGAARTAAPAADGAGRAGQPGQGQGAAPAGAERTLAARTASPRTADVRGRGQDGRAAGERGATTGVAGRGAAEGPAAGRSPAGSSALDPAAPAAAPLQGAEEATGGPLLGSGVDLQNVIDAIRATIEIAARQGIARARIALEPRELGEIRIHLTQTTQGLLARVSADSPEAARALLGGRGELHQTLSSLGTSLLRLDINHSPAGEQRNGAATDAGGQPGATGAASPSDEETGETDENIQASTPGPARGVLVDVVA